MRKILVIGSGKSTSYLIKYLLDKSETEKLFITIGDIDIKHANHLIKDHKNAKAILLDVFDQKLPCFFKKVHFLFFKDEVDV